MNGLHDFLYRPGRNYIEFLIEVKEISSLRKPLNSL
jgi:hypothetical protein